jgi:peptidoglycan lytic transglycosylase
MKPQLAVRTRRAGAALAAIGVVFPVAATAFADSFTPAERDVRVVVSQSRLNVVAGQPAVVAGKAEGAGEGERVVLERRGAHKVWRTVARSETAENGTFRVRYTPRKTGSALLRVSLPDAGPNATAAKVGRVNVFRSTLVSWYGPGFYGSPVACGGAPLGYNQLGVAHKTLPCGTKVTLRYNGRAVTVPVIDRGPYVGDREFDLTRATKDRLGFAGVGVIQVSVD